MIVSPDGFYRDLDNALAQSKRAPEVVDGCLEIVPSLSHLMGHLIGFFPLLVGSDRFVPEIVVFLKCDPVSPWLVFRSPLDFFGLRINDVDPVSRSLVCEPRLGTLCASVVKILVLPNSASCACPNSVQS